MSRHLREKRRGEDGFVLVWGAILLLPLLTLGLILLGYGRANVSKLRAQFNAVNLASMGAMSSEFKSKETLNSMAMLASAQGFTGVQPNEDVQNLSKGLVIFNHNHEAPGENKVAVYQKFTLAPLASLISSLGDVKTSGVAQVKPSKLYISVVLDYSRSLLADADISDLLKAFRVVNPDNLSQAGENGVIGPVSLQVEPKDYAQNALPFGVSVNPRYHLGWNLVGPVMPNFSWTAPPMSCIPGPENGCGGGLPTQQGAISNFMTNHFMMYKRAATVLVGVMAQMSRYLDVSVMGAPVPPRLWENFVDLSQGGDPNDPSVRFEVIRDDENDKIGGGGIFSAWRYDEPTVSGLQYNGANAPPLLKGQIDYLNSFENPKSPLEDDMSLSPTRILLRNIAVWPRKAAKYLAYESATGDTYSFSKDYPSSLGVSLKGHYPTGESYFLPAIPTDVEDPGDSFPFDPGPPSERPDDYGWLRNEIELGYGWPLGATPLLSLSGYAHPARDDFPRELAEVYEYRPSAAPFDGSGPQRENLAPLSKDKWKTGYWLCIIRDEMDDGQINDSVPCKDPLTPFESEDEFYFYDKLISEGIQVKRPTDGKATSPRCYEDEGVPACLEGANNNELADYAFVWCIHGYPRCAPHSGLKVGCVDPNDPDIVFPGHVICDDLVEAEGSEHHAPGYNGEPLYRGKVLVPPQPTTISKANLFYFLMDLLPTYGGTFHHNMVPNERCEDFLRRTDGAGRCAGIFVTDGVPRGTDFGGNELLSEERMLEILGQRMDRFTESNDARAYTWYLGKKGPLDKVVQGARAQFTAQTPKDHQDLIDLLDYDPDNSNDTPPPPNLTEGQCKIFDDIEGTGVECTDLNGYVLPLYVEELDHFREFKEIMDGQNEQSPNPRRVWVEAQLSSDDAGVTGLGSDDPTANPVIRSLRGLLATIKGARILDK